MENARISVCMATYNGEKYVSEQVDSIIGQIGAGDEIIVVDDCSTDGTLQKLQGIDDARIRIFRNEINSGVNSAFGRALSLAANDVIFLADQDDVWIQGRVDAMVRALRDSGSLVVAANSEFMDSTGEIVPFTIPPLKAKDSSRHIRNILKIFCGTASYYGCAMAFRRELSGSILPFPGYIESHDLWIAMAGNIMRSNCHVEINALRKRIHRDNASLIERTMGEKAWSRVIFLVSILHLCWRKVRLKKTVKSTSTH